MGDVLVIQTSYLGDVILTTPLIAELAKRGPVDVIATPEGAAVLANNPAIRSIYPYDKRGTSPPAPGAWKVLREIRRQPAYDAAYLAQGSFRSGLLAVMTRARQRIGFVSSAGRTFYTTQIKYRPDRHHAERLWWLAMSECADPPLPEQVRPRLYPSEMDREAVDRLLSGSGGSDTPYIALAPGSAWGTKRWPYYRELAERLAGSYRIAIIGSLKDAAAAANIASAIPSSATIDAVGRLSLLAAAELIGRAQGIVTNDSAPLHLASAMGTPTIAIFGPTVPEFGFGPLAERSVTVGHDGLGCRPCHRHGPQRCPLGHWRCMREVEAGRVHEVLGQVLNTPVAA